jgi:transcriptional regulator with XRE-family HTH domain
LDEKGVTQAEIGAILRCSQAAVSRRMTGVVDFRTSEIEALLAAFSIPIGDLLSEERAS